MTMMIIKFEHLNRNPGEYISVEDACKFSSWCAFNAIKLSDHIGNGDLWLYKSKRMTTKELFEEYKNYLKNETE